MPLNEIYMLRHQQEYGTGGKPLESVYFYQHTAGSGDATVLAELFELQVLPKVNALQSTAIKNLGLNIINMGNPGDFIYWTTPGTGDNAGEALPPQDAVAYTMRLNTRAVRKGSKRISGAPETAQSFGSWTDAGYITAIENLRNQLLLELVDASDTFLPIVIKRVKEPVVGTVPQQYKYRLPITDAELVIGEIVTVSANPKVGHQVSRAG